MTPISIIAEIGSSPAPAWNFETWCQAAKIAGATHVKAQLFQAEHFPAAEQASKRPLVFPRQRFAEFVATAHTYGLQAGASVFDESAVQLVAQRGDFLKLAAREQANRPLMEDCFFRKRLMPIYRSVSRCGLDEFMFLPRTVTLFAIQQYPASMTASLLAVVRWARFARREGVRWGWSSHTRGDWDCRLAARLGASVVEKHLALTETDLEAGHALNPYQFRAMSDRLKGVA